MIGQLQQSLGFKLQWDKNGNSAASGTTSPAAKVQQQQVQPLGGSAGRRRLRQITQLALRGFDWSVPGNELEGFVLELAATGGTSEHVLLERSDVFHTQNPTWEPPCGIEHGRNLSSFEFRASVPGMSSNAVLWRSVINLAELELLHCEDLDQLQNLPASVVPLVQLGNEWFTLPAALPASFPAIQWPPRLRAGRVKKIAASEICKNGDHISAMVARLGDLQVRTQTLRKAMEEPLEETCRHAAMRARRLHCANRVSELRRQARERREALEQLRSQIRNQRDELGQKKQVCGEKLSRAYSIKPSLEPRDHSQSLWAQLRCRQMRMLHEVFQVYPVEPQRRMWTIRGLSVASIDALVRQDVREEEHVSTALGFLAHLLVTVAGILAVPLRVEICEAGSSRSFIRDNHEVGAQATRGPLALVALRGRGASREWPLYFGRGLERSRFETALRLLKDGLHQFLYSRGYLNEQRVRSNNLLECAGLILRGELFGPDASN